MKLLFLIAPSMFLMVSCGSKAPEQNKPADEQNISVVDNDDARLTIFTADSAQVDFKKGIHRIIQYGLPIAEDYTDSLNEKYNFFYFYDMDAGCEVTQKYMDGVKLYNDKMYSLLDAVNGADWRKRYEKDAALLSKKHSAGGK